MNQIYNFIKDSAVFLFYHTVFTENVIFRILDAKEAFAEQGFLLPSFCFSEQSFWHY